MGRLPAGRWYTLCCSKIRSSEGIIVSWEILAVVVVVAGWIVLNRWILPKMGIST